MIIKKTSKKANAIYRRPSPMAMAPYRANSQASVTPSKTHKKIQNLSLAPNTTRIQEGLDVLEQCGILPREEFKIAPNELAERFLFGVNCTLSSEPRDYSLLTDQTDQEEIQNENIFNQTEYTNIRPAYITVPDKYPNSADPFYNIDERMPRKERNTESMIMKSRKPYLLRIASNASTINLRNKEGNRIKYFKDIKEIRIRGKF